MNVISIGIGAIFGWFLVLQDKTDSQYMDCVRTKKMQGLQLYAG